MAAGIPRFLFTSKQRPDSLSYQPSIKQSLGSPVSEGIRLEDPDTYEITPTMKDQFFKQMKDGNKPISGIRSMQNSNTSEVSSTANSPLQVVIAGENQFGSKANTNSSRSAIRKEIPAKNDLKLGYSEAFDPFVHSRGKHSHLQKLLIQKNHQTSIYSKENLQHHDSSFYDEKYQDKFGLSLRRMSRPDELKLNKTVSSPANPMVSGGLGYLSKNFENHKVHQPTQMFSPRTNPLASALTPIGSMNTVSYPEVCKCRKTLGGTCEIAEDWKRFVIRRPQDESYLRNTYNSILKRARNDEDSIQIDKDVTRTYPELDVYLPHSAATRKLTNILNAAAVHFPKFGYIQGMNFITASLIYHIQEEYLTFWVFAHLVEFLNLHELYKPGSHRLTRFARSPAPLCSIHYSDEEKNARPVPTFRRERHHS